VGILLAILMSIASVYQSFRAFHADPNKSRNRIITIICSLIVVCCSGWIAQRQSQTSAEVRKLVNTRIDFRTDILFDSVADRAVGHAPPVNGKNIAFTVYALPIGNEAKELRLFIGGGLVRGFGQQNDRRPWEMFLKIYHQGQPTQIPTDVEVGKYKYESYSSSFKEQDIADLRQRRARFYLVKIATWKNISGSRDGAQECTYATEDLFASSSVVNRNPSWQECPSDLDY
jgi:hypothetical protein